jgi:hypothetical protein
MIDPRFRYPHLCLFRPRGLWIGSLSLVYGIAGSFEFQKITAGTDRRNPADNGGGAASEADRTTVHYATTFNGWKIL